MSERSLKSSAEFGSQELSLYPFAQSSTGSQRQPAGSFQSDQNILPKQKKQRRGPTFLGRVGSGLTDTLRNKDIFGQPVTLNFQGSSSFQTAPGGLLSILFYLCLLSYVFLKLNIMLYKKDWEVTSQSVVTPDAKLNESLHLGDLKHSNLSLAIQLAKKRPYYSYEEMQAKQTGEGKKKAPIDLLDDDQAYEAMASFVTPYFMVEGILEENKRGSFKPFNNVTQDLINWKKYPNIMRMNSHGLYEITFNLEDAILRGTPAQSRTGYLIPRYQLKVDFMKVAYDAMLFCRRDERMNFTKVDLFGGEVWHMQNDKEEGGDLSDSKLKIQSKLANKFVADCIDTLTETPIEMLHDMIESTNELFPEMSSSEKQVLTDRIKQMEAAISASPREITDKMIGEVHWYYSIFLPTKFKKTYESYLDVILKFYLTAIKVYEKTPGEKPPSPKAQRKYENQDIEDLTIKDVVDNKNSVFEVLYLNPDLLERFMELFESSFDKMPEMSSRRERLELLASCEKITATLIKMKTYYENFQSYIRLVDASMFKFQFELSLQDEVEVFREWDDPQFGYPYGPRTTQIGDYGFLVRNYKVIEYKNFIEEFIEAFSFDEFSYTKAKLTLQRSETCLEGSAHAQLNFIFDFFDLFLRTVGLSPGGRQNEECEGPQYNKLRLSEHTQKVKQISEDYDRRTLTSKILIEIEMALDPFMQINKRSSSQVLDFFGDIGGFKEALFLTFMLFGDYFSAKFLAQSVANSFYNLKEQKEGRGYELHDDKVEGLKRRVSKITISTWEILTDRSLSCLPCCKRVKKRKKIVNKCQDKFTSDLDICNLVSRVNECYALIEQLKNSEMEALLELNKTKIIDIEDDDEEDKSLLLEPPSKSVANLQEALTSGLIRNSCLSPRSKLEYFKPSWSATPVKHQLTLEASQQLKSMDERVKKRRRKLKKRASGATGDENT